MEPHSQANDSLESKQVLEGQLRECFGRVVYSHKTHEKQVDILVKRLSGLKWAQIILSAIITGNFIFRFLGLGEIGLIIGTIVVTVLSAALLILTLYTKENKLAELVQKHKQTAIDIWLIREKYQSLITDLKVGDQSLETIRQERSLLMEDLQSVYSRAPSTTPRAYRQAQKALQQNEDMTFSDEEIDAFLPPELRRSE